MRVGVIGTGNIGRTVGRLLAAAGHDVVFGTRDPATAPSMLRALDNATVQDVPTAARDGEVVLCAVPYGQWPTLAPLIGEQVRGKVVIDAANPNPGRDGEFATTALESGEGAGAVVARLLPGARLVRTFSTVEAGMLAREAHRPGERLGLPVAGDDPAAVAVAVALVRDAGFTPVPVGGLDRARDFDAGTTVFDSGMTGPQVAQALGVPEDRPRGDGVVAPPRGGDPWPS